MKKLEEDTFEEEEAFREKMGYAFEKMEGLAYSMMTEFQQMKHYFEETYEEQMAHQAKMLQRM